MTKSKPVVGVTMGNPAGIGAEIIVQAQSAVTDEVTPLVIGDVRPIEKAIEITNLDLKTRTVAKRDELVSGENTINLYNLDNVSEVKYGRVSGSYGEASTAYTDCALQLVQQGEIDAIAGGPVNSKSRERADVGGTNELIERRFGSCDYWLLLIKNDLRVSHVTTHIPLRKALETLTPSQIAETIDETDRWLRYLGIEKPDIVIPGINPHAGYGGLLGSEEANLIEPALEMAEEKGITVTGPESPDTMFGQAAAGVYDGVVALYHDQGHIPIKTLGAEEGRQFNGAAIRIGLPIVFTTVAHGTSFEIAGSGTASPDGMVNAIRIAGRIAENHPSTE